jgi:hypothetical protein
MRHGPTFFAEEMDLCCEDCSATTGDIMHMCTLLAELMELGYEDLANACSPSKTPPMILAAWEGQASAILSMVLCKGNPDRQGSNWGEFFTAATSSYSAGMASTLHYLLNTANSPVRVPFPWASSLDTACVLELDERMHLLRKQQQRVLFCSLQKSCWHALLLLLFQGKATGALCP